MEKATTIEEAVSLITEPTEQPEAEAPEAEVIETEAEETPSQDESVDADDVEIDDFNFDLDDYQEVDQPQLITVKSDGKEKQVTLDELKQGYAGQDYIQRRMQEVAQLEKDFQQKRQALQQQQAQLTQLYEQAQTTGLQPPAAPTKELFEQDPIGYMEAKIKYDEDVAAYNQQLQQVQMIRQQQEAQSLQARQAALAEQAEQLKRYIPELSDPAKAEPYKKALVDTGAAYDFSADEIAGVSDQRMVRVLNDAMKYRRLQAKRKAAQSGDTQKPQVPSGAKRRAADGEAATRKKQKAQLRKTGRIEDALSLMLKP